MVARESNKAAAGSFVMWDARDRAYYRPGSGKSAVKTTEF